MRRASLDIEEAEGADKAAQSKQKTQRILQGVPRQNSADKDTVLISLLGNLPLPEHLGSQRVVLELSLHTHYIAATMNWTPNKAQLSVSPQSDSKQSK